MCVVCLRFQFNRHKARGKIELEMETNSPQTGKQFSTPERFSQIDNHQQRKHTLELLENEFRISCEWSRNGGIKKRFLFRKCHLNGPQSLAKAVSSA